MGQDTQAPGNPEQARFVGPRVLAGVGRAALTPLVLTGCTALVAGALLTGCTTPDLGAAVGASTPMPTRGWHGTTVPEPYTKPHITLTDTAGRPFRFDRDAHRPVELVVFGYTHCPWVCTRVLTDVAQALGPLGPDMRRKVQVLFVSVDPARDSTALLASWLRRFDPTFVGLTGPLPEVRALGRAIGVPVTGPTPSGPTPSGPTSSASGYTVGHGAQIVGFGPDGTAHLIWMPGTSPADLRADVVRLASSS